MSADGVCSLESLYQKRSFDFNDKASYDAYKDLIKTRNSTFQVNPEPPPYDIWKRKPPDFRFQAYTPHPPKRNSRDAMRPDRYSSASDSRYVEWETKRRETVPLPPKGALKISESDVSSELHDIPPFKTRFRLKRPFSAKVQFVKEGQYRRDGYSMPKLHDYRQYPPIKTLGLSEFMTHKDPDPYNIRLNMANRPVIKGALHEVSNLREVSGTMAGPVKQPEKWEQKLHLPNPKWPHRPLEYTRYRIPWRDPEEAFMDRVEEALQQKWELEKINGPVM